MLKGGSVRKKGATCNKSFTRHEGVGEQGSGRLHLGVQDCLEVLKGGLKVGWCPGGVVRFRLNENNGVRCSTTRKSTMIETVFRRRPRVGDIGTSTKLDRRQDDK